MTLKQRIDETEEKLEEEQAKDDVVKDDNTDAPAEDAKDDVAGDDEKGVKDEQDADNPKEDLTAKERARQRILERENADLRAELLKKNEKKEEPKAEKEDVEPDPEDDPIGHARWENRQLRKEMEDLKGWKNQQEETAAERKEREETEQLTKDAIEELGGYVRAFSKEKEDTMEVLEHLESVIVDSIRMLNPSLNATQVQMAANNKLVQLAAGYYNEGHNPAKALYDLGIEKGYKPKEAEKEESKTDLGKINAAKGKSANPSAGGRNAKAGISQTEFSKMSIAQKAKLTQSEIDQILAE